MSTYPNPDAYDRKTITQHGLTYLVEWVYDHDAGPPWEDDGHGPVSEWTSQAKRPGEMILSTDRGARRYYDFQAAVVAARAEGWNTPPYEFASPGERAHAAAMADYEYLRRWCDDQWHYCGIIVTLLDDNGHDSGISASLWQVEDEGYLSIGHHASIIQDLIGECEYQTSRLTFPVSAWGI